MMLALGGCGMAAHLLLTHAFRHAAPALLAPFGYVQIVFAGLLGLRESAASQHLALLRRDGLVQRRRDGQTIWYSITSEPARRVLETMFEYYCVDVPDASTADPAGRR